MFTESPFVVGLEMETIFPNQIMNGLSLPREPRKNIFFRLYSGDPTIIQILCITEIKITAQSLLSVGLQSLNNLGA